MVKDKPECRSEFLCRALVVDYYQWKAIFDVVVDQHNWSDRTKFLRRLSSLDGEIKELPKNYPSVDVRVRHPTCLIRLKHVNGGDERRIVEAIRQVRTARLI